MHSWGDVPVAVTGAGGFIGSHLIEALAPRGARVRAMVHYNSRGDRGALELLDADVLDAIDVLPGDVRDLESAASLVQGREVVFHLAAQIAIPYSYVNPRSFFATNVLGTLNVAQACLNAGVRRMIHTSTSEVYGSAREVPITEEHALTAQSPYAASKIGADQLVESFHRSYGLPASILRPFNTYGPRQSARAVIPTIIAQALAGEEIRLGSIAPRRDFTYVEDTAAGFLEVASTDATVGRTLQLGTGRDVSIEEVVAEVERLVGRQLHIERREDRVRPEESEVTRLVASAERLSSATGWRPRVSLAEGLARTVEWIEAHPDRYRPRDYAI